MTLNLDDSPLPENPEASLPSGLFDGMITVQSLKQTKREQQRLLVWQQKQTVVI